MKKSKKKTKKKGLTKIQARKIKNLLLHIITKETTA